MTEIEARAGPTRTGLMRLGRQFAAFGRATVAAVTLLLGALAVPAAGRVVFAMIAILVVAWSVVYVRWLRRGTVGRKFVLCDVAVVAVVALTQGETVPVAVVDRDGGGWVIVFVSVSIVALQVVTTVARGTLAVVAVGAALVLGVALSPDGLTGAALAIPAWMFVEAVLTRLLWEIVQRAADKADIAIAASECARREAAVLAARRAQERARHAMLHDTAATTLLMVGLGDVRSDAGWLRSQAERDLRALDASLSPHDVLAVELAPLLTRLVHEQALLRITLDVGGVLTVPVEVAEAVGGAVREALNNVARHGDGGEVVVRAALVDDRLEVEVVDSGPGFDPSAVPPTSRGIASSVVERMAMVGGRATVSSVRGTGTSVALHWRVS